MHKIDGSGNVAGQYVDEDPLNNVPGTLITSDWLNAVQAEIVNVIEGAGIVLSKADNTQLLAALNKLYRVGYMLVQDQRASGTQGGSPAAANLTTVRTLNTVVSNTIVGASLASNIITLPAGKYIIDGLASVGNVANCKTSLFNATTGNIVLGGIAQNVIESGIELINTNNIFSGYIDIATATNFDVRTFTSARGTVASFPNSDFGYPVSIAGQPEIFAQVAIRKVG